MTKDEFEEMLEYVRTRTGVSDIKRELYRQACVKTAYYILDQRTNCYKARQIGGKYELLNWALIQCRGHKGMALEFGVGDGISLRAIGENRPVHGFDSFEGLPEDWRSGFPKGTFRPANNVIEALQHRTGVQAIWVDMFDIGIKKFIATNREQLDQHGIAFIHIDSDLYQSAKDVLYGLMPWLGINPPTYILFDEFWNYPGWERGEFKAWHDFAPKRGWELVAYDHLGEGVVIKINEFC